MICQTNESGSKKDKSESKKVISAHKFMLAIAISCPVFYGMFYGQMAETTVRPY